MPSAVTCGDCGAQFEVTQDLWESKIDGKLVRVRCKRCGAKIKLDGRDPSSAPRLSKPPPANVREKLTSIVDAEPAEIREETPTVPLTKPEQVKPTGVPASHMDAITKATDDDPWMVSYADDDDREKTTEQVKAAFKQGEIHADTLIWRDGMDDWLVIKEVPVFAELFPEDPPMDQTGGFLGTGMGLGGRDSAPDSGNKPTSPQISDAEDDEEPPISLVPESLPPESIDPESVDPDSLRFGGMVALSAGTLKDKGKGKPPPPRRPEAAEKPAAKAEAPRARSFPKPPPAPPKTKADFLVSEPNNEAPQRDESKKDESARRPMGSTPDVETQGEKPQGKAKPRPPANLKRPETISFDKEDLPPDSAPDVGALSRKFAEQPKLDAEALRKQREDEELLRMGAVSLGDSVLGVDESAPQVPTIDVSDLDKPKPKATSAATAEPAKASSSDSAPPSSKKKKKRKAKSGPPSSRRVPVDISETKPSKAREPQSTPSEAPVSKPNTEKGVAAVPASGESAGGSKLPLYVGLGLVAAFAIYWFGLRTTPEPEANTTKPVATDLKPTEPEVNTAEKPREPTAEPTETAEPAASAETEKPSEPSEKPTSTAANLAETAKPPTAGEPKPEATTKPEATAEKPAEKPAAAEATGPFDVAAARAALASAAAAASSCRKDGDPSGMAQVTITFAPSGRATSANISGPPFAGTPTGGCIAATMRRASVPPFTGGMKTVSKTVVIH